MRAHPASVKQAAAKQYRDIVNRAAASVRLPPVAMREGWIATARKALGMSAAQLARRLGVKRGRMSQAERAELSGGVTLRSMQAFAEAMGCRFVYAIVPADGRVESVIAAQALKKARALVARAGTHMALENQSLSNDMTRAQVEVLAEELARTMPADFWNDD